MNKEQMRAMLNIEWFDKNDPQDRVDVLSLLQTLHDEIPEASVPILKEIWEEFSGERSEL